MDALMMTAASGMRSRMESLDILANDLANATAPGFKADREFYNLYVSANALDTAEGSDLPTAPVIDKHWTDFSQGPLTTTGNPLDFAIGGKGFFAVQSSRGILYTRDGGFQISKRGQLVTKDGFQVRGQDGKPITLDPSKGIDIGRDGTVRQDGAEVSKMELVDFADPHSLSKHGQNYFQLAVDTAAPIPAVQSQLQQGSLEGANFQPAESAVRLVSIMRQFDILQRAMSVGMEMNKRATDDIARVS
jgi:flagellar basal-body rod protein FlgF